MKNGIIVFCAVCMAAGLAAVWYAVFLIRRSNRRMEQMIEEAMEGNFRETHFDEDIHSATEARLAQFLAANRTVLAKTEKQQKQLSELLSDISHQIRTPLTNIRLYTQLLTEEELPGQAGKLTEELDRQTAKLQELMETLIQTSRLETGLLAMHTKIGDLSEVAEHAAAQYREKALEKQISIALKLQPSKVVMDAKWTEEALCNLVDNAIKYTQTGGCIVLESRDYEFFGSVCVSDNGPGIAEEEQTKIWGRFYRSPEAVTQEGVGIGLYLTRQILSEQSGYIRVKSKKGEGSSFQVYLPKVEI